MPVLCNHTTQAQVGVSSGTCGGSTGCDGWAPALAFDEVTRGGIGGIWSTWETRQVQARRTAYLLANV